MTHQTKFDRRDDRCLLAGRLGLLPFLVVSQTNDKSISEPGRRHLSWTKHIILMK